MIVIATKFNIGQVSQLTELQEAVKKLQRQVTYENAKISDGNKQSDSFGFDNGNIVFLYSNSSGAVTLSIANIDGTIIDTRRYDVGPKFVDISANPIPVKNGIYHVKIVDSVRPNVTITFGFVHEHEKTPD